MKIHQHLKTAWKIIDNYRLHYAFKQASKILNQAFETTGVQGKNCEKHQFSDQSTLAMKNQDYVLRGLVNIFPSNLGF